MTKKILFVVSFVMMLSFVVAKVDADVAPVNVCGNSICEFGETPSSCPFDCNPCGDGTCDESIGETPLTCSADCSGPVCGDGTCASSESYETCPLDCTAPPASELDPGISSPSCESVIIHVGEKKTCSIKVENVATFPLTQVVAQVTIPDKITKVDNTDSWSCMSTVSGVKCQKNYNPYLATEEIEYLELTLTTDTKGEYFLVSTITGNGVEGRAVTYSTSAEIDVTESISIATADAVDDQVEYNDVISYSVNLADNDTLCSSGQTTFAYRNLHDSFSVEMFDENTGEIEFRNHDYWDSTTVLFYDILCNGSVVDSAPLIITGGLG